jgi:cardiolipin synthase (CMP-forming)
VVGSKIRVNRVGKAATAVLMGAVALVVISPGVVGEILFYAGFGLSIVAGLMYVRSVRRIFGGGELR